MQRSALRGLGRTRRAAATSLLAGLAFPQLLSACGGGDERPDGVYQDPMDPSSWDVGAPYWPDHPVLLAGGEKGWAVNLPHPTMGGVNVNYITMKVGSLAALRKVSVRARVEAEPGVKILPAGFPSKAASTTLFIQRWGDDYSAQGEYEAYRWFAAFATHKPIKSGEEFTMEARFDQNWTAIFRSSRQNNPDAFQAALANAGRLGFVVGGGSGLGHGVYATGPARIVVTDFRVE